MKPYGYITLKEAAVLSGVSIETLKKQCQTGRIRGAVKGAGSWFVPKDEIIIKPLEHTASSDDALVLLTILTETAGVGVNVTLYLNGLVIEGLLISTKKYVDYLKNNLNITTSFKDDETKTLLDSALNGYFESILKSNETGKPKYVHLEQVTVKQSNDDYEPIGALLRLNINAVMGVQLGTTKVMK